MSSVQTVSVTDGDDGLRLDRWFRQHYPQLKHGQLQKLLRTGQIRVDGGRAKASDRVSAGQDIRVPPLPDAPPGRRAPQVISKADAQLIRDAVLHRDDAVIVINKPAGIPVQGGTKTERHIDGMLDALRDGAPERPRLVHRLDRDTSGVLVLGRTRKAAAALSRAFRGRDAKKVYWALTVGVPKPPEGEVVAHLAKIPGRGEMGERERVIAVEPGSDDARKAVTHYRVIEQAAKKAAWVALMPITGRTHQLRAHMALLGTPIAGDGKYGGASAGLGGAISKLLHLHARRIDIAHPDGGRLIVEAPLPPHMARTWAYFGFRESVPGALFEDE